MQKQWLFLFTYSWDNSSGFAWHQTQSWQGEFLKTLKKHLSYLVTEQEQEAETWIFEFLEMSYIIVDKQ